MHAHVYVRALTREEETAVQKGLRSSDGFQMRRSQIVDWSAQGKQVSEIASLVGYSHEMVRRVLHEFNQDGLAVLQAKSRRPHQTHEAFDKTGLELLKALLHHSPRDFGKATSLWTLELAAEVSYAQGLTQQRVCQETIRNALKKLRVTWKRAKHWITSPDPAYARKKGARDRLLRVAITHPDWVVGFEDECWFSRFEQIRLSSWADTPVHLPAKTRAKDDPDPKALSCYGVLLWRLALLSWGC